MVQVFNEMQAMFAEILPGPYLQQLILVTANVNSCHKAFDWCQTVLALNCPLRGHPSTSRIIDSIIALGYRGLLSVQQCLEIGESIKKYFSYRFALYRFETGAFRLGLLDRR